MIASREQRLRIIVSGYIGLLPGGGITWDYLQYPLGFALLGHDVYYIEDTGRWPVHVEGGDGTDCGPSVRYLAEVMSDFDMADRWAYRDVVTGDWFGMSSAKVSEIFRTADLFVNVSWSTPARDEIQQIPVRALIDSDPMFTQIPLAIELEGGASLDTIDQHSHHFTFGGLVGLEGCLVPTCGIDWIPTVQPICLSYWERGANPSMGQFTSVMNWSDRPPLQFGGSAWGQKDIELRKFIGLPQSVSDVDLRLAVGHGPDSNFPREQMEKAGWSVLDVTPVAGNWRRYRDLIHRSAAEFSVAKHTYVAARTGWFSGRSACYLAAGRPVVAQDTGWSELLATGDGLFAFDDLDDAAEAIREVTSDWQRHSTAASQIARTVFDHKDVLEQFLRRIDGVPVA